MINSARDQSKVNTKATQQEVYFYQSFGKMNLLLFYTVLLAISITFFIPTGSTASVKSDLEILKAKLPIRNAGLKCYRCNDTSCYQPRRSSNQIHSCSDLDLDSLHISAQDYNEYDLSNLEYSCFKVTTSDGTERGCTFNKVDNKEFCVAARSLWNIIEKLNEGLENYLNKNSGSTDTTTTTSEGHNSTDFQCSTCSTDVCNSL